MSTKFPVSCFNTTKKIWALLTTEERIGAVVLLGLMLVGMLLEMLGIGLVVPAIALFTQRDAASDYPFLEPILGAFGNPSQHTMVIAGMLILVGVYLFKVLFLAVLVWRQTRFAFNVQANLSQRLFSIYLHQPYAFHLQRNSAQLMRNIINEVSQFTFSGIMPGMLLITESLILFGICSLLLFVEPVGATIVVSVLGMFSWGFHQFTRKRISNWGKARQYHEGLRIQHLQQGLGGVKDVKLLRRENEFLELYKEHNYQAARVGQLQTTLQHFPRLWLELLAVCGLALLVISMMAQSGEVDALLPTLGLFAVAAFRLMPSINRILGALQALRFGLAGIDTLYAEIMLDVPKIVKVNSDPINFTHVVELDHISYVYSGATEYALKDISLTIKHGESVGLIGTSGAGKSTLVDVLLGLLTPDKGEVRVDDRNIEENLCSWQAQIGYVPQSIFLTDDTLRRNVAFGLPDDQIDDVAVEKALHAAQLKEFVETNLVVWTPLWVSEE